MSWFKKEKTPPVIQKIEKMVSTPPAKDRYEDRPLSDIDLYPVFSIDGFYRHLAMKSTIIRACINKWKTLCSTESQFIFTGSDSEIALAKEVIEALDDKLYSDQGIKEGGIQVITNSFFAEMFTVGRFAFEIIPTKTGDGVERIRQYDAYSEIEWVEYEKLGTKFPYVLIDPNDMKFRKPTPYFYYNAFNNSFKDPAGHSLLYTIEWVARVEEQLLLDMAASSHNTGYPRIHYKITPPEHQSGETIQAYTARVEAYFNETVNNFKSIEVDDNIFTWDSVEIEIVGAKAAKTGYPWRDNVEIVAEEVLSAMGLYPWVLGLSHGATKNWVEVQHKTLLTDIANHQQNASTIAEFIANLELKLKGIKATAEYKYEKSEDPNIHKKREAEATHFETTHNKYLAGYTSKLIAANELGYIKPENDKRIELGKKEKDKSNGEKENKDEAIESNYSGRGFEVEL